MVGPKRNLVGLRISGALVFCCFALLWVTPGKADLLGEKSWEALVDHAGAMNRVDVRLSAAITEELERQMVVESTERREYELMRVSAPGQVLEEGLGSVRERWEAAAEKWGSEGKAALVVGAYGFLGELHWRYGEWQSAEMWLERAVGAAESVSLGGEIRLRLLESGVMVQLLLGQPDEALRLLESAGEDLWTAGGIDLPDMDLLFARVWGSFGGAGVERVRMREALDRFGERLGADTPVHLQREYWSHRIHLALWNGRADRARHFLSVLQETGLEEEEPAGNPLALAWEYLMNGGESALRAEALVRAFGEAGCPVCFELVAANWYRLGLSGMETVKPLFEGEPVLGWKNHGTPVTRILGHRLRAKELAERGAKAEAYEALKLVEELVEEAETQSREKVGAWRRLGDIAGQTAQEETEPVLSGVVLFYSLCGFLLMVATGLVLLLRLRTRSELTLHLERMLEKAREAERMAERANRYKSQFLANVSHEIRTPMNGIIGMASLLEELITDERQQRCLETIQMCSQNLMVLLNDLVDLSRIETGTLELERIAFEPRELLEQSERLILNAFEEAGVELRVECAGNMPLTVVGDAVHIGQILMKLLHNALDRCGGTPVELRAAFEETMGVSGNLLMTVSHAGEGYGEEDLAMLFEPFSEAEFRQGSTHGNGLSLPLGSRLAESMGGKLEAESMDGAGCRLLLRVPVRVTREEPEFLRNRFNTFALGRPGRSTAVS